MYNHYRQLTTLSLLVLFLMAACTPVAAPSATTPPTAVTSEAEEVATESESTGCPLPTAETTLISDPVGGYCFLIPATFSTETSGEELIVYSPETTPGHRERAFVNVEAAEGRTLEEISQDLVAEAVSATPDFEPIQSELTLGGVPAIQIDNLPGQDANRQVFAVHEDRLYQLTFVPVEPSRPDAMAEMEELHTLITQSIHFMTPTHALSSASTLLTWEGQIDGACYTLAVDLNNQAGVALCGDEPINTLDLNAQSNEWEFIQQHFGAIDATTDAGEITFQGQGTATGDLWSQALASWASFTAMELNAGGTSASARTVLAWQVTDTAEHSGQCSHLIVLAYGYAYANLTPCDGNGESSQVAAGWLTDAELETLYQWLDTGTRVEGEAGYLDAKGSEALSAEEVATWSKAVYARMIQ
jgi:hypothetical protein